MPQYYEDPNTGERVNLPEPAASKSQISTYSTMSLIFGIIWLGGAGSLIAVILGHKALKGMRQTSDDSDRSIAMGGYVLGWIGVAAAAVGLFIFFLFLVAFGHAVSTAPY